MLFQNHLIANRVFFLLSFKVIERANVLVADLKPDSSIHFPVFIILICITCVIIFCRHIAAVRL